MKRLPTEDGGHVKLPTEGSIFHNSDYSPIRHYECGEETRNFGIGGFGRSQEVDRSGLIDKPYLYAQYPILIQ